MGHLDFMGMSHWRFLMHLCVCFFIVVLFCCPVALLYADRKRIKINVSVCKKNFFLKHFGNGMVSMCVCVFATAFQ